MHKKWYSFKGQLEQLIIKQILQFKRKIRLNVVNKDLLEINNLQEKTHKVKNLPL